MRQPYLDEGDYVWGGRKTAFRSPDQEIWLRRMVDKGWTVPGWPAKYGGAELSSAEKRVLRDEMVALSCRPPLHSFGISMLAPALFKYGSEELRMKHLPPMARGAIRWCQGYSEPNAGSDLASLRTIAKLADGLYTVSGSKMWTSYANQSDWIFCLVRTGTSADQREGISFILIDMASQGISTRPIKLISGASPFCQVFFDEAQVPQENLVGREGDGWDIAKYLLTHERSMISGVGSTSQRAGSLSELAKSVRGTHHGLLNDLVLRPAIAAYEIDALSFRYTKERLRQASAGPQNPGAMSSVLKYLGTELNKRRLELTVEIEGNSALTTPAGDSDTGPEFSSTAREWLRSKANSIEGGTTEVQLNIIARRLIGLP
jgi:acyl-CoA dehydrogenase